MFCTFYFFECFLSFLVCANTFFRSQNMLRAQPGQPENSQYIEVSHVSRLAFSDMATMHSDR